MSQVKYKKGYTKKDEVFSKTDGYCWYCGKNFDKKTGWSIDHQTSRKMGGDGNINNLVPSCISCNSSKNKRNLEDYRVFLQRKEFSNRSEIHFIGNMDYLKFLEFCKTNNVNPNVKIIEF